MTCCSPDAPPESCCGPGDAADIALVDWTVEIWYCQARLITEYHRCEPWGNFLSPEFCSGSAKECRGEDGGCISCGVQTVLSV